MKSKIIENVLRCPNLTHSGDKKCPDRILKWQKYDYRAKSAVFGVNYAYFDPVDPPGGQIIKSKIIENALRVPDITHKVDKKCSDMILNRPGTIIGPKVPFLA